MLTTDVFVLTSTGAISLSVSAPGTACMHSIVEAVIKEGLGLEATTHWQVSTIDGLKVATFNLTQTPPPEHSTRWASWSQSTNALLFTAQPYAQVLHNFPRPTSNLAQGTMLVEAGPDSGFALTTAELTDQAESSTAFLTEVLTGTVDSASLPPEPNTDASAHPHRAPAAMERDPADMEHDGIDLIHGDVLGQTRLRSFLHHPGPPKPEPPEWPDIPRIEPVRPPRLWHFAIPIGIGIVLVLMTHMWWFLLLSVAGPLTAAISYRLDTKRFIREAEQAQNDFVKKLNTFHAALTALTRQYLHHHNLTDVQPRSTGQSVHLVLGYGQVQADLLIPLPPRAREDDPLSPIWQSCQATVNIHGTHTRQGTRPTITSARIDIDIATTGLTLTGNRTTATNVARSIIAQLCQAHADIHIRGDTIPYDLQQWGGTPDVKSSNETRHRVTIIFAETVTIQSDTCTTAWIIECDQAGNGVLKCPATTGPGPVSGPIQLRCMQVHRFLLLCPSPFSASAEALDAVAVTSLPQVESNCAVGMGYVLDSQTLRYSTASSVSSTDEKSEAKPVTIDLFRQGPHALVAGTTGSGKSVFLSTWITALCMSHTPNQLRLILVDFKGGATFQAFHDYPHTDSVVSNLDLAHGQRALRACYAEVLRREACFATVGVSDIDQYNARLADTAQNSPMPRIVLVIDEFQALVTEVAGGTELIEKLTALGRSLGVHIVLATQRPTGVVTSKMKSNVALRVCLRVRDAMDSVEVVETDRAAFLDPEIPGLGVLSNGSQRHIFRSAVPLDLFPSEPDTQSGILTWKSMDEHTRIRGSCPVPLISTTPGQQSMPQPLTETVQYQQIVTPPLPQVFDPQEHPHMITNDNPDTPDSPGGPAQITGLIDIADTCATYPWTYHPDTDGSVLISGVPSSGKTHTVQLLGAAALAAGYQAFLLSTQKSPSLPESNSTGGTTQDYSRSSFCLTANSHWLQEYVITLVEHLSSHTRVFLAIDNFDELTTRVPHFASRLEKVFPQMTFALVAGRRTLHSPLAARTSTRLIFPHGHVSEAAGFGLATRQVLAEHIPGRAILSGPACNRAHYADVQFASTVTNSAQTNVNTQTLPATLPAPDALYPWSAGCNETAIELGTAPLGESVTWIPNRHGRTLIIHAPGDWVDKDATPLADLLLQLAAHTVTVLPRAHTVTAEDIAAATSAGPAAFVIPFSFTPSFTSPVSRLAEQSPCLIVQARTQADLKATNYKHLPVPPSGIAWFCAGSDAVPVTLSLRC